MSAPWTLEKQIEKMEISDLNRFEFFELEDLKEFIVNSKKISPSVKDKWIKAINHLMSENLSLSDLNIKDIKTVLPFNQKNIDIVLKNKEDLFKNKEDLIRFLVAELLEKNMWVKFLIREGILREDDFLRLYEKAKSKFITDTEFYELDEKHLPKDSLKEQSPLINEGRSPLAESNFYTDSDGRSPLDREKSPFQEEDPREIDPSDVDIMFNAGFSIPPPFRPLETREQKADRITDEIITQLGLDLHPDGREKLKKHFEGKDDIDSAAKDYIELMKKKEESRKRFNEALELHKSRENSPL